MCLLTNLHEAISSAISLCIWVLAVAVEPIPRATSYSLLLFGRYRLSSPPLYVSRGSKSWYLNTNVTFLPEDDDCYLGVSNKEAGIRDAALVQDEFP